MLKLFHYSFSSFLEKLCYPNLKFLSFQLSSKHLKTDTTFFRYWFDNTSIKHFCCFRMHADKDQGSDKSVAESEHNKH